MGLTRPRAYQIFDIDYKQSVRVVTVSNITLGGGAPSQVDGVTLSLNDRVLVTGQSTGNQNGLYYVTTVGTGSNGTWQRSIDGNETGEIDAGMVVMVTEGLVYADTQWKLITDDPIVIGTTALSFTQNYSANSISSGTSNVAVYSNANVTISVVGTSNVLSVASSEVTVKGNLLPDANVTYSLGSTSQRWKDLWISNSTIYIGETNITASGSTLIVGGVNVVTQTSTGNITGGNLSLTGAVSASGNITGNYILGNGALLTGVITSVANINSGTSNVTVVAPNGDITVGVGGTGNVVVFSTAGQNVTGYLTASGNITGGNIITTGLVVGNGSALTSITGANVTGTVANATLATTATSATTAGTVTTAAQPNITSVGTLSSLTVTGNITGGNINAGTGTLTVGGLSLSSNTIVGTGSTLTIDPNGSGGTDGQVTIAGNLQVTGNVTYINSNVITINDLLINVANNAATATAANGAGLGVGPVDAEYAKLTYNSTSNTWVISNGANVSGVVTATGNITGLNFIGNGSTLTSLTGANVTGTVANATYATSAGSATTAGTVTTASQPNITSVGTLSSLSVTGNVNGGNLTTLGQVSASGNISGNYFIGNGSQLTGIQADTIGGNITILTRATGNVNFAVTAGYFSILTRASGNVSFAVTA